MPALKVFTTAQPGGGIVSAEVIAALGDQPHHRQAELYVVAATKADAVAATGDRWTARQLRLATGNTAGVLAAAVTAGQLPGGVYAASHNQPAGPLVAFGPGPGVAVTVVGQLHRTDGRVSGFIPAGQTPPGPGRLDWAETPHSWCGTVDGLELFTIIWGVDRGDPRPWKLRSGLPGVGGTGHGSVQGAKTAAQERLTAWGARVFGATGQVTG